LLRGHAAGSQTPTQQKVFRPLEIQRKVRQTEPWTNLGESGGMLTPILVDQFEFPEWTPRARGDKNPKSVVRKRRVSLYGSAEQKSLSDRRSIQSLALRIIATALGFPENCAHFAAVFSRYSKCGGRSFCGCVATLGEGRIAPLLWRRCNGD